jgi:Mg-chelatase subunit ChlD
MKPKKTELIKIDAASQVAAEKEIAELFGSVPPSRYEAAHLTQVLDKSGSMAGEKANQLKMAVKELEKQFPEITTVTIAFDDEIHRLDNLDQYHPEGNTALLDGIVAAIEVTAAETAHNNVMVVVICDGEDNRSQTTMKDVAQIVAEKKAIGWQFYVIHIAGRYSLNYQHIYDQLGIPSITEKEIPTAVSKLTQGIYGYLETGKLLLSN